MISDQSLDDLLDMMAPISASDRVVAILQLRGAGITTKHQTFNLLPFGQPHSDDCECGGD